jgi:hypothetical protein
MENKGDGTQPALGFVLGRPIDGALIQPIYPPAPERLGGSQDF